MNMEKIGTFIAALRKSKGLTQQEVAERLGVSDKTVSKWECGYGLPDITAIPAIAELFEVTADEILRGERIIGDKPPERERQKTEEQAKYQIAVAYNQIKMQCVGIYVGMAITILTLLCWYALDVIKMNSIKMVGLIFFFPCVIGWPRWVALSDAAVRIAATDIVRRQQSSIKRINRLLWFSHIALFMLSFVTVLNILNVLYIIIPNMELRYWAAFVIALAVSLVVLIFGVLVFNRRKETK